LRFGLEIGALVGLGAAAWTLSTGAMRWVAVIAVPVVAATLWGVFNVLNDPSRSGEAPVEVAGWLRLAIELLVLGGGAIALGIATSRPLGVGFALLVAVQYAASWTRVQWLIGA
jgi:hypothetical protein